MFPVISGVRDNVMVIYRMWVVYHLPPYALGAMWLEASKTVTERSDSSKTIKEKRK